MRYIPFLIALLAIPAGAILSLYHHNWGGFVLLVAGALSGVGIYDVLQNRSAVLKNYPLSARLRFLLETFRPEIRQYFLESDHEQTPFSREQRALVYRRAKGIEGLRP
ncbi:MAG: FMN-binding glutamate synthase family protein, partial [Paracoccaceae bacterium]|nr:FMN-binding glutamate synthase family protein [Paracoccaceae bacterium]